MDRRWSGTLVFDTSGLSHRTEISNLMHYAFLDCPSLGEMISGEAEIWKDFKNCLWRSQDLGARRTTTHLGRTSPPSFFIHLASCLVYDCAAGNGAKYLLPDARDEFLFAEDVISRMMAALAMMNESIGC